jgi:hypothetical protein
VAELQQIAEASPAAMWCAAGRLVGAVSILLNDPWWRQWGVEKLVRGHVMRLEDLVRLEADIAHACKRANVRAPKLAEFFGGSVGG